MEHNKENKLLVLFHGTDARIIEMSEEERLDYLKDCNLVIDALYLLFKPLFINELIEVNYNGQKIYVNEYPLKVKYGELLNEKGGEHMYFNLCEKLQIIEARNNKSELYQYKDFYLCSSRYKAMDYARSSFAGGETGLCAYRLIEGAEIIGLDIENQTPQVKQAIDRIKEFGKKGKECPAIVTLEDVDVNYLLYENGKPIDKYLFDNWERAKEGLSFRYTKQVNIKECKYELLDEELYKEILEEIPKY